MNEMLKTLGRRSFAANRLQNLIAVLAIALTAVLFTSVTTIGMGVMESMTLTMQLQKGSRSDGDFRNMTAVLSGFSGDASASGQNLAAAAAFCPMYVLTNNQKLYGAGCMLYPGLLESISEKLDHDLFLLPSSIHEMILLPAANRSYSKELADMVAQINRTELAADEVLSDQVYYYSRADLALSICS